MHIFEKFLQILGLCPIVKFRSTLSKSDSPNIWRSPRNRKILHALLMHPLERLRKVQFLSSQIFRISLRWVAILYEWKNILKWIIMPGSYAGFWISGRLARNLGVVSKKFLQYRYRVSLRKALLQGFRERHPPRAEEFWKF